MPVALQSVYGWDDVQRVPHFWIVESCLWDEAQQKGKQRHADVRGRRQAAAAQAAALFSVFLLFGCGARGAVVRAVLR